MTTEPKTKTRRPISPLRKQTCGCPRRNRGRAQEQLGMTLIEIMVVTLIIALMSGGIAVAAIKYFEGVKKDIAKTDVKTLKTAVGVYALRGGERCPSLESLLEEEIIESDTRLEDPWKTPFVIDCEGPRPTVFSAGPDKEAGTEDDIH